MTTAPLARTPAEWFELGSGMYADVLAACARYGVHPHPELALVASPSPFPYYEPGAHRVTFGVPDITTVKGRLYWYFIQSLYGAADLAEVATLLDALLPWVMAHELGHHFRHAHGAPIDSDFVEEQIANLIAIAFLAEHPRYRHTLPEVLRWSQRMVARTRARATTAMPEMSPFRLDVGDVLLARGVVSQRFHGDAVALAESAEIEPEIALAALGVAPEHIERAGRDRSALAASFNRTYMTDLAQYWSFGGEWLVAYIARTPHPSLGEVLDRHVLGPDWEASRRDATRALMLELQRGDDVVLAAAAAEALVELDSPTPETGGTDGPDVADLGGVRPRRAAATAAPLSTSSSAR